VLAERLSVIASEIVSEQRSGFIQGRKIYDCNM